MTRTYTPRLLAFLALAGFGFVARAAEEPAAVVVINGKVLTVRADDVRAIAVMLDVAIDDVRGHLEELGILFKPATSS